MGKASLGLPTFINIHGFKVQSDPMTVNGLWESLHYFHIWSHTGDKPYECKHQGKAFTVASTCKIVKIDTREQPLERKECEKNLTLKSWLNTLKRRRDWRLNVCNKSDKVCYSSAFQKTKQPTFEGNYEYEECGKVYRCPVVYVKELTS